ncbi:MAG: AAA family ATPase [Acidimicrobiales bacterium]|nr:AAA family ATPase [Acidimicrobiales bacterium]
MGDATGQIGTRSVLFTDLVASTELRVRLGEEAADAVRRSHDALLRAAVAAHGGVVVKGLGDGIMATFASAAEAVAASAAVQQAVDLHGRRHPDQAFAVRVGLSIGDVSTEADDVFGVPVVEASRLCGAATGGEILAAELVRALARGRGGFAFEPMGDLELRGLAEPVSACRVLWEPLLDPEAQADGGPVPITSALLGATTTTYVGRDDLRDRLADAWEEARTGACRTLLLAGEPGVGKTRTAAELARRAHADRGLVLFGRCDEDLGVPYQPFVEALEHYVAHAARPALGRWPGELRRLVPDLGATVPPDVQPVASDPASEEHRLFEACTSWLLAAAAVDDASCVLVLDDIHWATKPTLQLLQHVVRTAVAEGAPLLVLATYRDTDIDRTHPLAAAVGDLRRLPGVDRFNVENLSEGEVLHFIEVAAGHDLDEGIRPLARAVYAETEGNPFFVGEVLRHLVETGSVRRDGDRWAVADPDHVAVPEGVRDVVGRRLTRLSEVANEVLSVAAVVGRDFDVDVVLGLVQSTEDATLDALDEAVRARLVEEVGVDRFRFAHALVRTTLYDELSATRRRRLHRRVADALEKVRPDDVRALAYHCTEGGPEGGDLSRALRYTLAAAEEALEARAFADAETRFRAALELVEDAEDMHTHEWVAATCGVGECLRDQGDPRFREVLLGAARQAIELGDVALAARAVLANTRGFASVVSAVDEERVDVAEATLDLVDPTSPTRPLVVGYLASELTFSGDHGRRVGLVDEALASARALGDERLLAAVIVSTGYATLAGSRAAQIEPVASEGVRLADAGGDPGLRTISRIFASGALLTLGRFDESRRVAEELVAIARSEGTPLIRWLRYPTLVRLPILDGDLERAQALADQMLREATELGQHDGEQWWSAVTSGLLFLRGTAGAAADMAAAMADQYPLSPVWRVAHAWNLAEAGRLDEARVVVAASEFKLEALVEDVFPFTGIFQLARCAWLVEDIDLGRRIAVALAPHRDRWGHYFMMVLGPVRWSLGLALATAGDLAGAVATLDEALRQVDEARLVAHLPVVRTDLARVLLRRNSAGDRARAVALLATAREEAERMGSQALVAAIDEHARR